MHICIYVYMHIYATSMFMCCTRKCKAVICTYMYRVNTYIQNKCMHTPMHKCTKHIYTQIHIYSKALHLWYLGM